jgi:hypothetical protein
MLLLRSTPGGPKFASSIVNKYGSSSAWTVPEILKFMSNSNHNGICVRKLGGKLWSNV